MHYSLFRDYTFLEDIHPKEVEKYTKTPALTSKLNEMIKAEIIGKFDAQGVLLSPDHKEPIESDTSTEGSNVEQPKVTPPKPTYTYKVIDENSEANYPLLEKNLLFLYNIWKSGEIQHNNPVIQLNALVKGFENSKKRNRIPKDITGTPLYDKINKPGSPKIITDIKNTPLHLFTYRQLVDIVDEYNTESISNDNELILPELSGIKLLSGVSAPFSVIYLKDAESCVKTFIALGDKMSQGNWCVNPRSSFGGYKDTSSNSEKQFAIEKATGHAFNYFNSFEEGLFLVLKNKAPYALMCFEKPEINNKNNSSLSLLEMQEIKDHWNGVEKYLKKYGLSHYLQDVTEIKVKVESLMKKIMKQKYGKQRILVKKINDIFFFRNKEIIKIFKDKNPEDIVRLYGEDYNLKSSNQIKSKLKDLLELLVNARVNIIPEIVGSELTFRINAEAQLDTSFEVVFHEIEYKINTINSNFSSINKKYKNEDGELNMDLYLGDAIDSFLHNNDPTKRLIDKIDNLEIFIGNNTFKNFLAGNLEDMFNGNR